MIAISMFFIPTALAAGEAVGVYAGQVSGSFVTAEHNPDAVYQLEKQKQSLRGRAYSENGGRGGQCVAFIQRFLGVTGDFRGYAGDINPNTNTPRVGRIVLLDYKIGHAALIIGFDGEWLELAESNYNLDEIVTVGRKLNINDASIRGYFDPYQLTTIASVAD